MHWTCNVLGDARVDSSKVPLKGMREGRKMSSWPLNPDSWLRPMPDFEKLTPTLLSATQRICHVWLWQSILYSQRNRFYSSVTFDGVPLQVAASLLFSIFPLCSFA